MRTRLVSVSILVLGAIAAGACGSSERSAFESSTDPNSPGDGGQQFGGEDKGASCTECSADLHDIVTCGDNPEVISTCPPDQACSPTGCVPACEGAAANKSSIGCDYFAVEPDTWSATGSSGAAPGSCFAAFVTNNWNADMQVEIEWKGKTIDATPFAYVPKGSGTTMTYEPIPKTGIPPNGMAIVFLNQWAPGTGAYKVTCPVKAAIENEDIVAHGTGIGKALEIRTSVPAVVYDVYPFGGAKSFISSATLLLPVSAWDTNYIAATMSSPGSFSSFPGGIDLVAQEDGTEVTLLPTTDIAGGSGISSSKKNTPVVYKIDKGETVHILNAQADLTGSVVQSNKPVGVWGEHFCMTQPNPPKWRIVGTVDGTELTYDPPIAGGPKTLDKGQLFEFDGTGPFEVTSQDDQHPFYLAAHRPGSDCDAAHQQIPPVKALGYDYVATGSDASTYGIGGPETVNMVPPAQFLPSYVFFTDPTYSYTELAVVRKKVNGQFDDVTLDCFGDLDDWQPVGKGGEYEVAHVRLRWAGKAQGKCDNGRHTISSKTPFGVTVWGYDSASSYAYPAGASVKPINTVVVPPSVK